jgi:acyl-CoA synthetase (AMP-forming)/AMP-acid ligase II
MSDLDAHLRERLAGFKRPKRIERIEQIPRNAAGKILRGGLPE